MARNQDNEPELIKSPRQRTRILTQLKEDNALLTVQLLDVSDRQFGSALIKVDPKKQVIELDELNPRAGHEMLAVGQRLRVQTRAHGVETRFRTTVQSVGEERGISYYVASFPEAIRYHQRRAFHRVPVKLTMQSKVSLSGESANVEARLTDLSVGGFGAVIKDAAEIVEGEMYTCEIKLRNAEPLKLTGQVRFSKRDTVRRQTRIGVQFVDLKPGIQQKVQKLVMELEREMVRST